MVARLAPTDPEGAVGLARSINEPWFRSQALAWAARFSTEERLEPLLQEALHACHSAIDRYRAVAIAAWPLRALIERGRVAAATRMLNDILVLAPEVEPPASRAEALFLVWQAIFPLGVDARKKVLDVLLTNCRPEESWRIGRIFHNIAWMLSASDPKAVERILAAIPDGRWKRQAERRVAGGDPLKPRIFFWGAV
jgi:hypothetical protein